MSAYIVDRETIRYLVQLGIEAGFQHHLGRKMRWYHDGVSHWLDGPQRNGGGPDAVGREHSVGRQPLPGFHSRKGCPGQ